MEALANIIMRVYVKKAIELPGMRVKSIFNNLCEAIEAGVFQGLITMTDQYAKV